MKSRLLHLTRSSLSVGPPSPPHGGGEGSCGGQVHGVGGLGRTARLPVVSWLFAIALVLFSSSRSNLNAAPSPSVDPAVLVLATNGTVEVLRAGAQTWD